MEKYKIIKTLGDGAFGTVFKATNTNTGQVVAIKKFKQKYKNWDECVELRQVKSLRKLNHPNIVKLKEVLQVSDELYLVFEYLQYNLFELYSKSKQNKKRLTENEIRNIVYQVVAGLAHMHKNGFFHRDMKPQNLLIYNNVVKICDFGLARQIRSRPPFTDYVSTRWYRAPQLLLRSTNYNSPVDIFGLGCIMAELYMQAPLFAGNNQMQQLNKIVKILGTPDKNVWPQGYKLASNKGYYFAQEKKANLQDIITTASPQAIDLIQLMLQYQSRKRPTASDILKHPYFQKYTPIIQDLQDKKQILFESKPEGKPLDAKKLEKKLEIFRATKQKFRMTKQKINQEEDLDTILKQLQEKQNKKNGKLPTILQNPNKNQKKELRQSKTQIGQVNINNSYKIPLQQPRNFMRFQPQKKEQENFIRLPAVKKQPNSDMISNKLNYNFQPIQTPLIPIGLQLIPNSKYGRPLGLNNNFNPIQRINIFKQRDLSMQGGIKARSQNHYNYKF